MSLAVRDEHVRELMDDPDCDPQRLAATLRRFDLVNRLVAGWGGVARRHLLPRLARLGRPARVLDLGCGGGDVVIRLARLARRAGVDVAWTGADPDERAIAVARARTGAAGGAESGGAEFRCADAATLLAEGERFDAVISNHTLHHLGAGLAAFVTQSRRLSQGIVLHGDIARSRAAYALYTVGITPLAPGTFLRTDGLRSIRRSYTRDELQRALDDAQPGTWTVHTPGAFRLLAESAGDA
ncbi:MAG TPA: methyltransferase domain-containing protein [Microbacterium sp.]|nr:methyltransferase domain-containing protein [Microbacterium sp.]